MTRYAVIFLAILVGAAVGLYLARRRAMNVTTLVEEGKSMTLLPWIAGLLVLLVGLFLLADYQRSPVDSEYRPAEIRDGEIQPGGFDNDEPTDADQ